MGPTIIATIDPIITLSITKRIPESVGGDNIRKPIIAINPPRNPPITPHLNRSFKFFIFLFRNPRKTRIMYILAKHNAL